MKRRPSIAETLDTLRIGDRTIALQRENGGTFRIVLLSRPAPNGPLRVEEETRGIEPRIYAEWLYRRAVRLLREERREERNAGKRI